jgi:thiol-disulfide isomerase/thioredoxin
MTTMIMMKTTKRLLRAAALVGAFLLWCVPAAAGERDLPRFADSDSLPEFAYPYRGDGEFWFNSPPLSVRDLRGKVALVDFWTFGCYNCLNSLPWLKAVEARFADAAFIVVGIHTPEFAHEKDRANVAAAIARLEIKHPVMADNDYIFWQDMGNRYWPSYYIADKRGKIRGKFIGEVHSGTAKAGEIEALISALLAE